MKPTDLPLLISAARPILLPDGRMLCAVSNPDLEKNVNRSRLVIVESDGAQRDLTAGPADSSPVLSPDGVTLAFLRSKDEKPPQLYTIRLDGGEPTALTDHPLGVSSPVFNADGSRIAYLAAVPEPGRYGTDEKIDAGAEAPRRFTSMSYRLDGRGFVLDRPDQLFVLDLTTSPGSSAEPVKLTDEPRGAASPVWWDDEIIFDRPTGPDSLLTDIVRVQVPAAGDEPAAATTMLTGFGSLQPRVVVGDTLYLTGEHFDGVDFAGRTPGVWAWRRQDSAPRRLTDEATVHVAAIRPQPLGGHLLIAVENRGAVELRLLDPSADSCPLAELPVVYAEKAVVKDFAVSGDRIAAVVATQDSFAELVTITVGNEAGAIQLTQWGRELAKTGIVGLQELSGTASDGYPVHGWLLVPEGEGPHPVLLNVHGGPHAQYGWGLFDEAQVYAGAGYAVVMGNPRGSSGYGQEHGRAVIGAMGQVDVDDVLSLLDVALQRPEVDADRVGVMGGSYGGFMTSWLSAHHGHRFVAGISERAVNAWDSFLGASDIGHFFAAGYVGTEREKLWAASPLAYADQIDRPLLIIHSEQDWRCPLEQAQRLFVALRSRGAAAEMLLFPGEGHELSRSGRPTHRQQRLEAILDWWGRHLPVNNR